MNILLKCSGEKSEIESKPRSGIATISISASFDDGKSNVQSSSSKNSELLTMADAKKYLVPPKDVSSLDREG